MHVLIVAGAVLLGLMADPADADQAVSSMSNPEVTAIFEADQAARADIGKIAPMELYKADSARRQRLAALLRAGQLHTADDFYHAAFVYQHGSEPGDYLLAHTLAVAAVAEGRRDATWIAAATLDRYLQEIHQPQIYGTQYSRKMEGETTQAPYDRDLVPDALRQILKVPTQAEQEKRRFELEARNSSRARPPLAPNTP